MRSPRARRSGVCKATPNEWPAPLSVCRPLCSMPLADGKIEFTIETLSGVSAVRDGRFVPTAMRSREVVPRMQSHLRGLHNWCKTT
jgi:hypothetical protein